MNSSYSLFFIYIAAVVLQSCNNGSTTKTTTTTTTATNSSVGISGATTAPVQTFTGSETTQGSQNANTYIRNMIMGYYMDDFKAHSAGSPTLLMNIDSNHRDGNRALLNGIQMQETSTGDSSHGATHIIPYPSGYISGDLNEDQVPDYIVPVYANGGGNAEWRDVFIFISHSGDLSFLKMFTSYEFAQCHTSGGNNGQFYPESISGGILTGTAFCYADTDAQCCPSIKSRMDYKFDNGFALVKKTPL